VADHWFVRGPAVHAPTEEHRSTVASRPSSSRRHRQSSTRPIKGAIASPRASTEPPASIAVLAPSSTSHEYPEPNKYLPPSLGLAKARALVHCPAESPPCRQPEPPRPPPPPAVARPRWTHLHPNFGHQRVIGELLNEPNPFPGRVRYRPRRIASPQFFQGCSVQTRGIVVKVEELLGVPAQKCIFNSVFNLLNLVKSLENLRKFLVSSTTTLVILT
jgi:hypothetical protein